MLEFQPLTLGELPRLRDFFKYSGGRICDTTPGTVFMWRDMYRTEYAVCDGSLYFKVDYPGLGPTFPLPLGGGRPEHFRRIAEYCCRQQLPISFGSRTFSPTAPPRPTGTASTISTGRRTCSFSGGKSSAAPGTMSINS